MKTEPPDRDDELPKLLMPREAFVLLGVKETKGKELLRTGKIPGVVDFGPRCKRVRRSVLLRWLNGEKE